MPALAATKTKENKFQIIKKKQNFVLIQNAKIFVEFFCVCEQNRSYSKNIERCCFAQANKKTKIKVV